MPAETEVAVTVNGEARRAAAGTSLAGLLAAIGLNPVRVAVERNRAIVPRSTFGEVIVNDGDAYEIVHFVGGG